MTTYYTLADYNLFERAAVSEETMAVIQFLGGRFGTTVTIRETREPRERKYKNKPSDDSWTAVRDFKPTIIAEKKEGLEQWMSEIRGALNKISTKNYDTNSTLIVDKLHILTSEEEIRTVAKNIFDIASTNKFFSDIYAKLYKKLLSEFPEIFENILETCIQGFANTVKTLQYVDQNVNYDEFCRYNKENDKRKATAVFITNLAKEGVIPISKVNQLVVELLDILVPYMTEPNKMNEVEEITENIYLLITSEVMRDSISEMKPRIEQLANIKPKELPSMSSRAIFKYIDIMEKI